MSEQELLKLLEERDNKIAELSKSLQSVIEAAKKDHEVGGIAKLFIEINKADKVLASLKEYGYEL